MKEKPNLTDEEKTRQLQKKIVRNIRFLKGVIAPIVKAGNDTMERLDEIASELEQLFKENQS